MMGASHKLLFLLDDFTLRSPSQQLLDRFLIGYPRGGAFYRPGEWQITAHLRSGAKDKELEQRVRDYGLNIVDDPPKAFADAKGIIAIGDWGRLLIKHLPQGARCLIYGTLGKDQVSARELLDAAYAKHCLINSGSAMQTTFPLPPAKPPQNTSIDRALIIVQGKFPAAELDGLHGLFPWISERKKATTKILDLQLFRDGKLWEAIHGEWWTLVKSALSRSDTPQGDPVTDGRTQDLTVANRLERLAHEPRAWMIKFADGLTACVLVFDGVVADYNVALQSRSGGIISTQLYRPPGPGDHHFSEFAGKIDQFLRSGQSLRPMDEQLLCVELMSRFRKLFT